MPYKYSYKTIFFSRILEIAAFICLFPQRLFLRNKKSEVNNILLIEPFQMGDIVALSVLFDPLKQKYPAANIFILTKNSNRHILDHDDRIKQVLTTDFPWSDHGEKKISWKRLKNVWKYILALRKEYQFDIAIEPRGDVRSQIILRLLRCTTVVGYTNYVNSNINLAGLLLDIPILKPTYTHRFDWNRYLLVGLGYKESEIFPIKMPTFRVYQTPEIQKNKKHIVIHIGSGWQYRQWQKEKWILLLNQLVARTDYDIEVIGSKADMATILEIKSSVAVVERLRFTETSFELLVQKIQNADLFVGLDSGPMNIASSLGIKSLILFGPGDSQAWKPYNKQSRYIHKKENFPCNPCLQKKCYYSTNSCMTYISVEEVEESILQMIK
jgi:ADP-heptose:LPS heptosyltransferase